MLYQAVSAREPMGRAAEQFWQIRNATEPVREMAERLARGAHAHLATLDAAIENAATHWRLDRIATIDLCVLRIGAFELTMEPGTPAGVIIDEAVELAKRFGEEDTPAFVNGVLDAIRRKVRPGSETSDSRS
jgi:N utilization substance protein B